MSQGRKSRERFLWLWFDSCPGSGRGDGGALPAVGSAGADPGPLWAGTDLQQPVWDQVHLSWCTQTNPNQLVVLRANIKCKELLVYRL